MKVLTFVGMPGSGKTLASKHAKCKGVEVIRLGDLTDIELKKRGLEVNEKNEKIVREDLREKHGMAVYAEKAADRAEKKNLQKVVLDGVRSYEEYLFLKEKYGGDFIVVALLSSPKTRYERLKNRKERPLTKKECKGRDKAEIKNLNHGGTIAMADKYIINEGTKEEFKDAVDEVVEKFIKATA